MIPTDHAEILNKYLSLLPLGAIEQLLQSHKVAWAESLNGNATSLNSANKDCLKVTSTALSYVVPSDLQAVESLIKGFVK